MRLIELRLKNLNSLKGEWHIDFTNPAFVNEGIFAITGRTGAGKTTILDAICLALYSRTPRLGDITGSTNEMMTQGTGECSAEVVIEIGDRHYRCSWYQHRAHKKAKGNLLPIKHEIMDIKTTKILEEKKSKTATYIQELIGMDFNQFTRSIMLAQGSFAAFLKSDVADRAAILEKITGTAIYAEISTNVFEKKREEESQLAKLQAGVDSLPLLSVEYEAQLTTDLQAHEHTQTIQRATFKTVNDQIQWLDNIADLQQNLDHYQGLMTDAVHDEQNFIPDATRLEAANKALEIDSLFRELAYNRDSVKRLSIEQEKLIDKLPTQQAHFEQAVIELNATTVLEEQAAIELRDTSPIIAKVRVLDAEIRQQSRSLHDENGRKNVLLTSIEQLSHDIKNHKITEQQSRNQLIPVTQYLNNHLELNDLDTDIALFNSNGSRLKTLLQDNATLITNQQTHQDQATRLQTKTNEVNHQQTANKLQIADKRTELENLQQQQLNLLQNSSLPTVRSQQGHIEQLSTQIERIGFKLQQLTNTSIQINTINDSLPNTKQQLKALEDLVTVNKVKITDAKDKRKDKQQRLNLLQKVAKLEDYITELQDGHPCPLCGATEHPYTDNKQPHPLLNGSEGDDSPAIQAQKQINELDKFIDELAEVLSHSNIDHATKQNNLSYDQQQLTTLQQQYTTFYSDIQSDMSTWLSTDTDVSGSVLAIIKPLHQIKAELNSHYPIDTDSQPLALAIVELTRTEHWLSLVSRAKQNLAQEKDSIKTTLLQYDNMAQKITDISAAINTKEQQQLTLTNDVNNLTTQIQLNTQKLEGLDNTITSNFAELTAVMAAVADVLAKYATSKGNVMPATADNLIKPLSTKPLSIKPVSINLLIESIHHKKVLNTSEYDAHLDHLRQQHSTLLQLKGFFNTQKESQQRLLSILSTLSTQIENKQAQLDSVEHEHKKLAQLVTNKTVVLQQLEQSRTLQFDNKNPDDETLRLQATLDEAKSKKYTAQRQQHSTEQVLKQLQDRLQQLSAELNVAKTTLKTQDNNFAALLTQLQFETETDFNNARLLKEERDLLKQRQSSIEQALNHAQMQLNNTQQALNTQLAKPLTTEPRDILVGNYLQLQTDINTRSEEIGAIKQQLNTNEQQKGEQTAQNNAIIAQKQKMQVWQQLYELIGSKDGKKYRTFAQGLTFQVMISHANKQLEKMSDRYLLIHDENNALELNVIDNYQGGDIRSTKNLSGGEGFIISLALALGLSQMASQNIRVDSLFLDEGFGTLDEESLDIALDTLTSLQQEGKIIGIISHVQALKERIITQIQVKKISGGFSEISGQGCSRIAS